MKTVWKVNILSFSVIVGIIGFLFFLLLTVFTLFFIFPEEGQDAEKKDIELTELEGWEDWEKWTKEIKLEECLTEAEDKRFELYELNCTKKDEGGYTCPLEISKHIQSVIENDKEVCFYRYR